MTKWALFGGAGFIGQHLAFSVLNRSPEATVDLLDIQPRQDIRWKVPLKTYEDEGRLRVLHCDVRNSDLLKQHSADFDTIVNLAAIHRGPGHRPEEYFETNVKGAENICRFAEQTGCREILFTSSISVYGVHDQAVDERSGPQPKTPYGQSKLEAENIHRSWAERTGGRLAIVRPGVVFGPGEGGNVSRLVSEMLKRDRKIRIRPDQTKAGIYIEELLDIVHWLRGRPVPQGTPLVVNGVSNEILTFNDFGEALQEIRGFGQPPLTFPESLLKLGTAMLKPAGWFLPATSKVHPERLAKLTRANDIRPTRLIEAGYPFGWPLERALADWLDKGL